MLQLGSLKSFGGKGKTPLEDGGGQAFGEFDVILLIFELFLIYKLIF
jgi:hypothetical protein